MYRLPLATLAHLSILLFAMDPGAANADSADELAKGWQAWREGRIVAAHEASAKVVAELTDDDSARHLAFLTAFVVGQYQASLDHYAALPESSELRQELLSLALDGLEHLGRFDDAVALATTAGAPTERVKWLEARRSGPLKVELAGTTVVPFSPDNFLSELMPAVPIEIDGMSLMGHLDTGGSFIAMSPRMAENLGISVQPLTMGFANNRETTVSMGLASKLVIGDATLHNVPVAALDALTGVAQGQAIEDMVILGTNVLQQFLSTWDNGERRLVLSPRDAPAALEAHYESFVPTDAVTVPFHLYSNHYMFANGRVGEREAVLFLDTGLVTVDSKGRQPALGAARSALEDLGLATESDDATSLESPPIALGELLESGHSIYVLGDRVAFDWHGLAVAGLLTHGFTKNYSWTLDFDRRLWHFAKVVEPQAESQTESQTEAPSAVAPQDLAPLVGDYAVAPGVALTISADGDTLYLQAPGQQPTPLEPQREDVFAIPLAKAEVSFFRDPSGAVTHFALNQNGIETRATRIP